MAQEKVGREPKKDGRDRRVELALVDESPEVKSTEGTALGAESAANREEGDRGQEYPGL